MIDSKECYGCGEIGHIRRNCPRPSYRPPIARGRGGHGRGRYSGGRGGRVMVVTKTAEVMGKLGPLHHNMVGATDRRTIGPIVTLSLGGLKRRHLMLSLQVIFWFVIAWLLYYLILDPRFLMYLPHLLMV